MLQTARGARCRSSVGTVFGCGGNRGAVDRSLVVATSDLVHDRRSGVACRPGHLGAHVGRLRTYGLLDVVDGVLDRGPLPGLLGLSLDLFVAFTTRTRAEDVPD